MHTYSTSGDKIKDAIRFLKIGIENNETTLLLLSRDIEPSYIIKLSRKYNLYLTSLISNHIFIKYI